MTSLMEVRQAKQHVLDVKDELTQQGIPFKENVKIGIMIETPASAVISDLLAKEVGFFSIGTNDLTQYTLAMDRQNRSIAQFCDPHHPAVLRLIETVANNAHTNGIWVGICGELAADPTLTKTFLDMGIDELSVAPPSVLAMRKHIYSL